MGQHGVWRRCAAALGLALPAVFGAHAAPAPALVTILEGDAVVLRETQRFAAAEGLALRADDIVSTGAAARLVRIELEDGRTLDLGPATQLMLLPRALAREGAPAGYLLQGWAKLTLPTGATPAPPATLATPRGDAARIGGTLIASVAADRLWLFAESGSAELLRRRDGKSTLVLALKDGDSYLLPAQGQGTLARTPPPELRGQVPRAFIDTLPRRSARFAGRVVEPAKASEVGYAEIAPWVNGEAVLRQAFVQRLAPRARDNSFRNALVAEMKLHPEWQPVLFPPPPPKRPQPAPAAEPATARAPEADPATAADAASSAASAQ